MRILLAIDGSTGAELARTLVATQPWPDGTTVEALRVVEPVVDVVAGPGYVIDVPPAEILDLAAMERELESAVGPLRAAALDVEPRVVVGRPATCILDQAREGHADLIVVGSRGRGPIASMVLGSVSAEVAGHAPCPVLVVRSPSIRRVLLALDGTPQADRVLAGAIDSPLLAGRHVSILSVAPSRVPTAGVMFSGGYGVPIGWYEESVAGARAELERAAQAAAASFAAAGIDAAWSVLEGDPAATIIDAAERGGTDLVVVGTHGRVGLARLVLGSVARNVLLQTHASVLVVPGESDPGAIHHTSAVAAAAGSAAR